MSDQSKENSPAVNEQEKQIASKALHEFRNSHYDECIQLLKKLSDLRSNDGRVTINKAVADFYQSNSCKTDELRKQLMTAKKQLNKTSVNTSDELNNIGRCFLMYNEGVLHYHLKQPKAAINILERLFKVIEPLDDSLAVKVCFCLVELYLTTYKLDQAHGMLKFIEDVLFAPKTFAPLQSSENKNGEAGKNQNQNGNGREIPEQHRLTLYMFKARLPLFQKSLKDCKRELKSVLNFNANNPDALFLKSNYEYVRGNYPKAIKLLNSAPLATIVSDRGQSMMTLFYNNMSCIHFRMKKFNLAVFYARKALEENITAMKSLPPIEKNHQLSGRPLQTLAINKRSEILYNMGVQQLFACKPVAAFDCLMESTDIYECHPRYWLRLTEACIMVHQQFQKDIINSPAKKCSFVRGVVGSGSHRKIVLSPIHDVNKIHRHESQSSAMPAPTIEFGNICLSNAMRLLPSAKDIENALKQLHTFAQDSQGNEKYTEKSYALGAQLAKDIPGEPISLQELHMMRISVIACHAYVALGLGDYVKSLDYSKELLSQSMLPGAYKYLGRLYMAESLIRLDRITEAIQELSPDKVTDISTTITDSDSQDKIKRSSGELFPGSIQEARAIMLLNLASAYAIRGENEKSKRVLQQIFQISSGKLPESISTHAILLSAYIELKNGNMNLALDIIKRGEVFPSGRLVDRIDAARMSQQQQYQQHYANLQQQQQQQQSQPHQQPIQPPQPRSFSTAPGAPASGHAPFQQRPIINEDLLGNLQRPF